MLKQLIDAICFRLVNGPLPQPQPTLPAFEIAKLDLKPGDFLVLRFPGKLTPEMVDRLKTQLDGAGVVQKAKILVFEGGADLAVFTPPPAEPHLATA